MSLENVEIVRRTYALWISRQWPAIPDFFAPDVEIDLSRNVFNPDVYHGYSGVERYLRAVAEIWDDFQVVPTELIDAGEKVLVTATISGRGKSSGVEVTMEVMSIWTLSGSRVVRVVGGYQDRDEALEAAGLSEQDADADS